MSCVEAFIILPVTSFYFSVVSGSKRSDKLVSYTMFLQMNLKHSRFISLGCETIREFRAIIRLYTFDVSRKGFNQMLQENGSTVGIMLLKAFNKAPARVFVNGSILKEMLTNDIRIFQTGGRDEFYIYLDTLAGKRYKPVIERE